MKRPTLPAGIDPHGAEAYVEIERMAYRQRLDTFLASREAGKALTLDALKAGITLTAVVDAAADVAAYADEALAIVDDEYRPALDCTEGCCYCCCKPGVLISIPELLRILNHVRSTSDAGALAALRERARRYAAEVEGRSFNDRFNESVPCPLLVDRRCSVYSIRPLVCRGYNSTNVDACRGAHEDTTVLVPLFSMLKDVTDGATVGSAQGLKASGFNDALVDLGTALNIALERGDGFADSVIENDDALRPAQNTSWVGALWGRVRKTARSVGIKVY